MVEKKVFLIQIDDATLQQTLEALHQLPRKGRALREVIAFLSEEIQRTLAKGYSYPEVVEFLKERGIAISENTLRQYLSEALKTRISKKLSTKKPQPPDTSNLSSQYPSDKPQIPTLQSTDPKPQRPTIGNFVEMPDEL